jgi:hypothetical protein
MANTYDNNFSENRQKLEQTNKVLYNIQDYALVKISLKIINGRKSCITRS